MISALLIYFAINSSTGGRQKQRGPNFEISIFVRSCYHHLEKVSYRNIFTQLPIYVFFYIFASKAPWYEGGTMVPWGRSDRWTLSFSILYWEMNLLPFCFTLRWICGSSCTHWEVDFYEQVADFTRWRAAVNLTPLNISSLNLLQLEASLDHQVNFIITIIHWNHQYLELNIYSRPIWTAQPIWGRLTMAICLSNGASKAFARGKFDVL